MLSPTSAPLEIDAVSYYHYVPTRSVCILFIALYSISTAFHLIQALYPRRVGWWLLFTVCLGGVGEILGWSSRLWSNFNIQDENPFIIQAIVTVLSPTPILGGIFIMFAMVIERLGTDYSRLKPKTYSRLFLTSDITSLIVQAAGGSLSASNTESVSVLGGHITLAGIAFQLLVITVFVLFSGEFFFRFFHDRPAGMLQKETVKAATVVGIRMKLMIAGMTFSTACLYIRAIYRTIELSHGYGSAAQTNQLNFDILDGAMVVLALCTLNMFHPGFLLEAVTIQTAQSSALGPTEQAPIGPASSMHSSSLYY